MISFELGHVYARAGVRVMIIEALPRLLPAMDADAVAHPPDRKRTHLESVSKPLLP